MSEQEIRQFSCDIEGKTFTIETGKFAEQAGGAVTVQVGETLVLATATMSKSAREGIDFLPLSVDYEEKIYAAGRIPGSFFRREGRPHAEAILIARLIDRPLRPLFPKNMRNDIQIITMSLSHDQENHIDIPAMIGASTALTISNIPWDGPIGGVRVGLIDGEFVINPTIPQMEDSVLDLRMAGTEDAIIMVECGATEVPEVKMVEALRLGHNAMQPAIQLQKQMREEVGKEKDEYISKSVNDELRNKVRMHVDQRMKDIIADNEDRDDRKEAVSELTESYLEEYGEEIPEEEWKEVDEAIHDSMRDVIRRRILDEGVRPDGRDYTTIRELSAHVGVIPRVHGSGLFKRGQTQVLTIATLGAPGDARELDGLDPQESKRYMHHYNFPPYSTGETWPMRGPRRREIGHGALAETALRCMIPDEDEFPYTIRLVSEVMSSNGSTSMGSVCGSTLSLMDAGVPIKRPVGGIAMGLIKDGEDYAILTDIQGLEDHLGDMDFKVAGTDRGITALQMDIKIKGISDQLMAQALNQARMARLQILKVMLQTIPEPRKELSRYAPRMTSFKIDPEKIGAVIGSGGKTIRGIQDQTGAKVDIEDDGTVTVTAVDGPAADRAREIIQEIIEDPEIGKIYTGTVVRIEPYGAFVEFLPGKDGLVHISQLSDHHIQSVESEVSLGDEIMVMVTDVAPDGKVKLSRQAVMEGWTIEEARARDSRVGGGRGRSSRRDNRGRRR
jgi:polyribonucleotide nucleotidyltransferase